MAYPSLLARTKDWGTEILTDADLEGQFDLIIDWINDAMSSSTGHKHDATGSEGPKILTANIDDAAGTAGDLYTNTSGTTVGRLALGTAFQVPRVNTGATAVEYGEVDQSVLPDGAVVQIVNTQDGAVATGTTVMPQDDTTPQITEGDQYMSLAITPKATTNKLKIDVVWVGDHSNAGSIVTFALFNTDFHATNALAAMTNQQSTNTQPTFFSHFGTASDFNGASATTFLLRVGSADAGTTTFNGKDSGTQLNNGLMASSITITEIKAS